ncbi:hypothetical protein [Bacillus sp. T33-2]|nr:hypothetical protein [Bacillus sp. T33-2]
MKKRVITIDKKKVGKEIIITQPVINGEKEDAEIIAIHQAFLGQSWDK